MNITRLVRVLPVVGAIAVARVLRRKQQQQAQPAGLWDRANAIVDESEGVRRPD